MAAIQQDAPNTEAPVNENENTEVTPVEGDDKPVHRPKLDRDITIENIVRRKRGLPPITGDEDVPKEEEEEGATDPGDEGVTDPEPDQMVTLKVNGQEVQKTQAEVDAAGGVAAIQKQLSGDMKLAQAAEERKKLDAERERFRQIEEENRALREQLTVEDKAKAKVDALTDEQKQAKAKELTQKFFTGDASDLETVMLTILNAGSAPTAAPASAPVDTNKLVHEVATKLTFETERKAAVKMFEETHADLAVVKARRDYVNRKTVEVYRTSPHLSPLEIINEAVRMTREELAIPAVAANKKDPGLDSKRESKRNTVDVLPQASQRVKPVEVNNKPKTKKQIFEEIAARRSHT